MGVWDPMFALHKCTLRVLMVSLSYDIMNYKFMMIMPCLVPLSYKKRIEMSGYDSPRTTLRFLE